MSSPAHLSFRTDPSLDGTGRGTARESLTAALLALFSLLRSIYAIWTKNKATQANSDGLNGMWVLVHGASRCYLCARCRRRRGVGEERRRRGRADGSSSDPKAVMGVWEEVAGGERPAAGVLDLFLSISSLLLRRRHPRLPLHSGTLRLQSKLRRQERMETQRFHHALPTRILAV